MAELDYLIERMVNEELKKASNFATRSTIKMRAGLKLIAKVDLTLQSFYETKNLIQVDVSCSRAVEKLWMSYYSNVGRRRNLSNVITNTAVNNSFPTSDELSILEKFLAKDFIRNVDLIRLTTMLKRRLPEKDLNFIFAVDGLHSRDITNTSTNDSENNCSNNDFRNYFENLLVPIRFDTNEPDGEEEEKIDWIHVKAIRTIYKRLGDTCTPEKIRNVLRKLFNINCKTTLSNTTSPSNEITDNIEKYEEVESSSDSDENDDENVEDIIEKNIETTYKSLVGHKLLDIASWKKMEIEKVITKEMSRKRKNGGENGSNDDEHKNKPGRPRTKKLKVEENRKRKAIWMDEDEEKD